MYNERPSALEIIKLFPSRRISHCRMAWQLGVPPPTKKLMRVLISLGRLGNALIIARMTLKIKLGGKWSSFQLANSAPSLCVTDSAIALSARILSSMIVGKLGQLKCSSGRFSFQRQLRITWCSFLIESAKRVNAHILELLQPPAAEFCECVTPKGALRPAVCHANATREGS